VGPLTRRAGGRNALRHVPSRTPSRGPAAVSPARCPRTATYGISSLTRPSSPAPTVGAPDTGSALEASVDSTAIPFSWRGRSSPSVVGGTRGRCQAYWWRCLRGPFRVRPSVIRTVHLVEVSSGGSELGGRGEQETGMPMELGADGVGCGATAGGQPGERGGAQVEPQRLGDRQGECSDAVQRDHRRAAGVGAVWLYAGGARPVPADAGARAVGVLRAAVRTSLDSGRPCGGSLARCAGSA
jgi:hypothetical protein